MAVEPARATGARARASEIYPASDPKHSLGQTGAKTPPTVLPTEFQDQVVEVYAKLGAAGWIQAALYFDHPLEAERIARAFRLMLDAEPVLGCRFDPSVEPPVWRRRDDLDQLALCPLEIVDDVEPGIDHHLATPPEVGEAPNLNGLLLRHSRGDVLLVRISHVVADGTAAVDTLYGLATLYRQLTQDPDYRPEPNPATRDSFVWKRSLKTRDWASIASDAVQSQLRQRGRKWGLVGDPAKPLYAANATDPYCVFRRIDDATVAEIEAAARLRRATLNDVLLAAFLRAFHGYITPPAGVRMNVIVPVSLRRYTPIEKRPAIRNLGSFVLIDIGCELGAEIGATLDHVLADAKRHRKGFFGLAGQLTTPLTSWFSFRTKHRLLTGFLRQASRKPAPPCVTNIGVCRSDRLDFGGIRPADLTFSTTAVPFPIFLTLAIRYDRALMLSMSGYGSDLPRDTAERFLATIEQQMRALCDPAPGPALQPTGKAIIVTRSDVLANIETLTQSPSGSLAGSETLDNLGGWDSMCNLEYRIMIESKLGLELDGVEVERCRTVDDLIDLLGDEIADAR